MRLRVFCIRDVVPALLQNADPKMRFDPVARMAARVAAAFLNRSTAAFTLDRDPEETIWLVRMPDRHPIETALAHETLHIALLRVGEPEASKALDDYLFFSPGGRKPIDSGGI